MSPDVRILRALKALRQADGEREAPAAVEANLMAAYRDRQRQANGGVLRHHPLMVMATLAAASIAAVLLVYLYSARQEMVPINAVARPVRVEKLGEQAILPSLQRKEVVTRIKKNPAGPIAEPPVEMVTDFFPLMDVPPPLGRGQLLRVAVPASAMVSVGLPVREERWNDPVQADVLIGEEGMVRAIRFVSQRN